MTHRHLHGRPRAVLGPALALGILGILISTCAHAGLDFDRGGGRWAKLSYQHASIEGIDRGLEDANWILTGRLALTERVSLRAELPFTHLSSGPSFPGTPEPSSTALGNVFIGVEVPKGTGSGLWEFGAWLPTSTDSEFDEVAALVVASAGDFVTGIERYYPNTSGLLAMAHLESPVGRGTLEFRWDLGVSVADMAGEDWKGFVLLGGHLGYGMPGATRIGVGLDSRTSVGDIDSQLAWVDFVVDVEAGDGLLRPAVQWRKPLDEDRSQLTHWLLGVALKLELP